MFGYWKACPENVKAAWGARAILNGSRFDLVWDRQTNKGERDQVEFLHSKLNGGGLEATRETLKILVQDGSLRSDEAEEFVFYDSDKLKIVGNTNGSCGYLYLLAYLK